MRGTPETEMGGAERQFPKTSWSVLVQARDGDSTEGRRALERLLSLYWKPVYCVIRNVWSKGNEDAKDLTQEFFAQAFLAGSLLQNYLPERGRFRAYVKAAVMNFLKDDAKAAGRWKRGGGARVFPLEGADFDPDQVLADPNATSPEHKFDAAWKNFVLARALEVARERLHGEGKDQYFEVLRRYDLEPDAAGATYQTVGHALDLSSDTVKNYLTRARRELRDAVLQVVGDTVGSEEDLAQEMEALFGS